MSQKELQVVVFSLFVDKDQIEYGVSIEKVQEINRLLEITKMPQMPDFVEGIINLRGNVIPIIDLKKRFFNIKSKLTDQSRIIVCNLNENFIGVIVDEVSEVLRLSAENIEETTDVIGGVSSDYINGIAKVDKRLIVLLELENVFNKIENEELAKIN
ncbi:Positive regulator of CheA protein activity (CheW) [Candidatus Syntrophocurvum alkaliphilum]|uniref:Positive regulator of CheA protein activity (CheW) n=1 Tax=Candidatus Syntrophocurvum alkaliphilum TaxID=2293317 RepID=A0A6I6DGY4_9FIRM|nr:chemotaxis protein CheW [Candidatus Syntrophocurvum alkaliphilum]QGT99573.1 Positive regulator of CheA protein activity (CheW) [Candidatus Syntrophocurvum alkaliphilum]